MQKNINKIAPILFLYYEQIVCPLLLYYNKVHRASSLTCQTYTRPPTHSRNFEDQKRTKLWIDIVIFVGPPDSNSYRGCWIYDLVLVELFWNINKTCWVMSTRCKEQLGKSLFAIKLKPFVYFRSRWVYILSSFWSCDLNQVCDQAVIRQSSGSHQAVIRQLSQSSDSNICHS